jgi:hypothetical protein
MTPVVIVWTLLKGLNYTQHSNFLLRAARLETPRGHGTAIDSSSHLAARRKTAAASRGERLLFHKRFLAARAARLEMHWFKWTYFHEPTLQRCRQGHALLTLLAAGTGLFARVAAAVLYRAAG